MSNIPASTHNIINFGIVVSILAVGGAIGGLFAINPFSAFSYIFDIEFLRGFGLFVVHVGLAAIFGGGIGVGLAKLIQLSDGLAESVARLLRLGHWLPFFVLWGLPSWKPSTSQVDNVTELASFITQTIAVVPMIVLSSCYFRSSSVVSEPAPDRKTGFTTAKPVLLHSLLICLLWQMWLPSGWPWHWFNFFFGPSIGIAVLFQLGATVWFVTACARVSWQHDLDARRALIHWQSNHFTAKSFVGAILIVIACLIFWQLFKVGVTEYFLVAPPSEVLVALYRLLAQKSFPKRWQLFGVI
jgi:hypothetical protein